MWDLKCPSWDDICCAWKSQEGGEALPVNLNDLEALPVNLNDLVGEKKSRQFFPDGSVYEGQLKNGMWNGPAIYISKEGNYFKGNFVDNMRCGPGLFLGVDGHRYEGEWQDDQPEGVGKLTFPNGDTYEGHFSRGCLHGHGIYTWADGRIYDGTWDKDKLQGKGNFSAEQFDFYYQGEWRQDMPNGIGKKIEGEKEYNVTYLNGNVTQYSLVRKSEAASKTVENLTRVSKDSKDTKRKVK